MNKKLLEGFIAMARNSINKEDLIHETISFIRKEMNVDSIGVRLIVGDDYPYYTTIGFSDHFIKAENYLCKRDECGNVIRDEQGKALLQCVCGNVIRDMEGKRCIDCPFYLKGGGFVVKNSASEQLADYIKREKISIRGKCIETGYKTIILIPIPYAAENIGLIQLNGYEANAFNLEDVETVEQIGIILGKAIGGIIISENNKIEQKKLLAKNIIEIVSKIKDITKDVLK